MIMSSSDSAVKDTGCYSFVNGRMPEGCRYCVKGEKLVLFITGLCGLKCFYCPVSEKKIYKDVIYANEWKINNDDELIEEVNLTKAKGAGITGGDPLVVVDRVCKYLRLLKEKFGKNFHMHMYTSLQLVDEARLKKLYDSGLDEIRFHFDLYDKSWWNKVLIAGKFDWDVGVEIPCIPSMKKEILELISFVKDKVDFVNMNELEISERNINEFEKRDFVVKDSISYAVKGSAELGLEILNEAKNLPITLYFCTAKLKDAVQMKQRIIRRAKSIKKDFDVMTDDGMLIRGVVYLNELSPGFDYRKKLENADKRHFLAMLDSSRREIMNKFNIDQESIFVDDIKLRIIMDQKILKKIFLEVKDMHLIPAVVEEYPTHDAIEIDVEFL